MSPFLKAEVDVKECLSENELTQFISKSGDGDRISNAHPLEGIPSSLVDVTKGFFDGLTFEQKRSLPKAGLLPKEIDGQLLYKAKICSGRKLTDTFLSSLPG